MKIDLWACFVASAAMSLLDVGLANVKVYLLSPGAGGFGGVYLDVRLYFATHPTTASTDGIQLYILPPHIKHARETKG